MARLNFVALAAAVVLAMVTLPAGAASAELAVAADARDVTPATVFDPLNDPEIEILEGVEDTDFDDILGDDEDEDDNQARALESRRKHHAKHHHKHSKVHKASKSHKTKKNPHRHSRAHLHISTAPDTGAKLISKDVMVTWYAAHDLLNPACGAGGWQPTSRSHVAAIGGTSNLKCGDFLQLCATGKKRCVKVRVVDACAGCNDKKHIDLSKAAFLQLATGGLDQGEVHGVHSYDLGSKISPWALSLFGGKLEAQGRRPY
ncbi:hypothetical protein OC846_000494 [Tilletia horrida]|uniref:RlpA-like protein double-psi beta-barrel domain-containing protein n=1 Tax=Tilletia horrida TaxID=155126 RepID=A0AAN6JUQ7_9BASI|nr:hypothetical protein OC845_001104 [Tilletia horrida]KAK0557506.1 hypothetical protein OC846_000494 [Tilletia horrida]KAK0567877.1 hypothetical protein OC861_002437 [Tilletia horrida]